MAFSFVLLSVVSDSGLAWAGVSVIVTRGKTPQSSTILLFIIPFLGVGDSLA